MWPKNSNDVERRRPGKCQEPERRERRKNDAATASGCGKLPPPVFVCFLVRHSVFQTRRMHIINNYCNNERADVWVYVAARASGKYGINLSAQT